MQRQIDNLKLVFTYSLCINNLPQINHVFLDHTFDVINKFENFDLNLTVIQDIIHKLNLLDEEKIQLLAVCEKNMYLFKKSNDVKGFDENQNQNISHHAEPNEYLDKIIIKIR